MNNSTINYYDNNAEEYFFRTINIDMTTLYERFLNLLKPNAKILDVGAGSGRDLYYFSEHGYVVKGVDASRKLCEIVSEKLHLDVECCDIRIWTSLEKYDGIWANASLLHLSVDDLNMFLKRIPDMLNDEGVAFLSFKTGITTGVDEMGRYNTEMNESIMSQMISNIPSLVLSEYWKSCDKMNRNNVGWINFILRKAVEF